MSVFRRVAVVAASMLAAASIGVAAPGAASATSTARASGTDSSATTFLCVHGTNLDVCAYAEPGAIAMVRQGTPSITHWNYPSTGGSAGEITQSGNGLCMQLDHAGGNIVIEATCDGASFQLWEELDINVGGPLYFRSLWDLSLCLQYDNAAGNILVAGPCVNTWYQWFWSN